MSEINNENIKHDFDYPGKALVNRGASSAMAVCYLMATTPIFFFLYLFFPWRDYIGKIPLFEFPSLGGLGLVMFLLLGVYSGHMASQYLRKAPPEAWLHRGRYDNRIPLPLDNVITKVTNIWILTLIIAVVIHHRLLPKLVANPDAARISSLWLKILIMLGISLFIRIALTSRVCYELHIRPK